MIKKGMIISCAYFFLPILFMTSASAANMEDLVIREYAKTYNVDINEAERRIDIMAKFGQIEESLNREYGDSIAGIYFQSKPDFKIIVRTTRKGKTLKNIKEVINDIDLPIEVYSNSPRNHQAIKNIIENQGTRLKRSIEGLQSLAYNPELDAISILIYEPDLNKQDALRADKKLQKISGMNTELVFIDEPISTSSVVGGAPLKKYYRTLDIGDCTAGFSGTNSKGQDGIITAAHCGEVSSPTNTTFKYKGFDGKEVKMTLTGYNKNASTHDLAFLTLDEPSSARVINGYSTIRNPNYIEYVDSYAEPAPGTFICHQGTTTGFSCGKIQSVMVENITTENRGCPSMQNFNQPCSSTFAYAVSINEYGSEPLLAAKGDSGGPVFSKYPLGIHSSGTNGIVVFSKLKYLSDIGVKLKTK